MTAAADQAETEDVRIIVMATITAIIKTVPQRPLKPAKPRRNKVRKDQKLTLLVFLFCTYSKAEERRAAVLE